MGWHRRALVVLAAALGASVALPAPATTAAPAAGACADDRGITVVVDLGHFGGGIQVRCAPQPVSSGFEALRKAGFEVTGTQRFPGLLCRIDGKPASDPCVNAPSSGAYWAYWHAPRGGDWTYSTSGASRRPPEGSVEGWAFGARVEPGIAPPAPVPRPTTATTTTTTAAPLAPPPTVSPSTTAAAPDGSPPTPGATTRTTVPAAGSEGGGAVTTTTGTDAPGPADETAVDDREGEADPDDAGEALAVGSTDPPEGDGEGAGSPVAALVTAAVLAAAIGGGVWWRRRGASAPGLERGPG